GLGGVGGAVVAHHHPEPVRRVPVERRQRDGVEAGAKAAGRIPSGDDHVDGGRTRPQRPTDVVPRGAEERERETAGDVRRVGDPGTCPPAGRVLGRRRERHRSLTPVASAAVTAARCAATENASHTARRCSAGTRRPETAAAVRTISVTSSAGWTPGKRSASSPRLPAGRATTGTPRITDSAATS